MSTPDHDVIAIAGNQLELVVSLLRGVVRRLDALELQCAELGDLVGLVVNVQDQNLDGHTHSVVWMPHWLQSVSKL